MNFDDIVDYLTVNNCEDLVNRIKEEIENVDNSTRLITDPNNLKKTKLVNAIYEYFIKSVINKTQENMRRMEDGIERCL